MINIVIGILIGGTAAMVFPEQAATGFDFFRDNINMIGQAVVEATE